MDTIRVIDMSAADMSSYAKHLSDCVIVTHDQKLLLQQRPFNWGKSAGNLNIFGGHVEDGETPEEAVIREIKEETGGIIEPDDLIFLGAVTEDFTNHTELVHVHFWHDKNNTITGCYEAEAVSYHSLNGAISHPKIMDYTVWALNECMNKGYFDKFKL